MPRPETVRIGFYTYTIDENEDSLNDILSADEREEGNVEILGCCNQRLLKISIAPDLPLKRQQEVIWHEVSHAVQDLAGIQGSYNMTAEAAIGSLSTLQLMVLHENPDLVQFLLEGSDVRWERAES